MSAQRPVGVFGLKVPPNGLRIEANPGLPAAIQISMAAIDPTEEVITSGDAPARATLKIVRNIFDVVDEYASDNDEEDEDYDDDDIEAIRRRLGITESDDDEDDEDDEGDSDEEMVNGAGPSDPEKTRKIILQAMAKQIEEDEDDEEMADIPNGINGVAKLNKGKARAIGDDDESSEDGMTEYVVCTLDTTQHFQQPITITIGENEECYFRVTGSHTIHLTGNFVVPAQELDYSDGESEDEDDEDLEARLMAAYGGEDVEDDYEDDSEDDGLDDLADPRIMEVDSEAEEAPQLVKAETGKKNKKRAAEEETDDHATKLVTKLTKNEEEKPKSKKLKNNEGKAVAGAEVKPETKKETKKEKKDAKKTEAKKIEASPVNGKKVQFAEKLEQGPTPSKAAQPTKRTVQGVQIEDRKNGTGPSAKKGDRVGMRYIGKLKNGKMFDSNKKGKPFSFKMGTGEVIKGWDIGVAGMAVGGERRIIVPAHLAYGNKAMPGLPANSELTFDLKLISLN